ncbi:hypothetical protein [Bacteroides acidifaciens]|uniref:hypothetical protein n=1 Tax=Bacteroides acidifaciens TaxID=85831 RepID=UPI000F475FDE|nr:hypothetical protein [Bacteroides acidifaciens]ROT17779.1 hypothetical protein EEL51_11530 [Muribaculaceae bacterium Isolate-110 (HZI)]
MNRILIIDASESDRRFMAGLLVKSGYEPIVVETMEAAKDEAEISPLRLLQRQNPPLSRRHSRPSEASPPLSGSRKMTLQQVVPCSLLMFCICLFLPITPGIFAEGKVWIYLVVDYNFDLISMV